MKSGYFQLSALMLFLASYNVQASTEGTDRKLNGYQPSHFVMANDGVDKHIEFNISIKYPLDSDVDWLDSLFGGKSNKLYFAYTGQYDFFIFSDDDKGRESSPIVSRTQNPGLFFKHLLEKDEGQEGFESIAVGWFHESNGQQIEDRQTFLTTTNASDFVSRGWDYLGIDVKYRRNDFLGVGGHTNMYARLRLFCDCQGFGVSGEREDDTRLFGDAESADIRDFDGLRFIVDHRLEGNWNYGLQLKTGVSRDNLLENWSYRVDLTYQWDDVPITFFYFDGFGENISTYHIRSDYIGVGFKIW